MVADLGSAFVEATDVEMPGARGLQAGEYDAAPVERQDAVESTDFHKWRLENIVEASYGMIWLDIEVNPSSGCSWASYSYSSNCEYLGELINAVKAKGKVPGVYTSIYEWEQVMGSRTACTSYGNVPLWYAHYDGSASFSDYVQIGGWTKPAIKQYVGDATVCGVGVDKSFY